MSSSSSSCASVASSAPAAVVASSRWLSESQAKALLGVGLAGISNGCAGMLTNHVDVLKVRMQMAGAGALGRSAGVVESGARILREEGWRGFRAGLAPSLLREMSYSGLRMGLYEPTKELLGATDPTQTPLALKLLAGAITGATGAIIANPLDLVKVRMQSAKGASASYSSVAQSLLRITREGGGIKSLWRGAGPTVQRAALLTGSQVPSYDHAKHYVVDNGFMSEGYLCHFSCCMFAGVVAAAVTAPFDLAKSRIMVQPVDPVTGKGTLYGGTFDCLRKVVHAESPAALFKGFHCQWCRIGPHTTISLMIFEQLRHLAGMRFI